MLESPEKPGRFNDSETGLNYNYFRDYDAQIGRYAESDPIGLDAGGNTYSYVLQNPVSLADPTGLVPNTLELTCIDPLQPICWIGVLEDIATSLAGGALLAGTLSIPGDTTTSNVIEFPQAKDKLKDCPPDDGCKRDQDALLKRQILLAGLLSSRTVSIQDYIQKATALNRDIKAHNARCPMNKVAQVPVGPRGV